MAKKAIFGALTAVLVIAAVVGVVATVVHSKSKNGDHGSSNAGMSTSSRVISAFCSSTDYHEACQKSLSTVANGTASTKDLIKAAFHATIEEFTSAFNRSSEIHSNTNDRMNKDALADCKVLLADATDELKAAFSQVGDPKEMSKRVADIKNWLSAVLSYKETCLDGITNPEIKTAMESVVKTGTELTINALAIVTEVTNLLKTVSLSQFKLPEYHRRLLQSEDITYPRHAEGLPKWFSASDRKLLAYHSRAKVNPNVVVAKDGSGNFKTINEAINNMPKQYTGRYVIYVKAGMYNENVILPKTMVNIFMYGDGAKKTVIADNRSNGRGFSTFQTATFSVLGLGFIGMDMGFSNTAGPQNHQAVALRVQGDMAAFFRCRMDGYQDTLYVQAQRQFYRNCVISGTVDFIFGDSTTVIQNSLIVVRRPMDNQQNTVTAHGRSNHREPTGLVIHNCRIVPDKRLFPDRFKIPSYLGRPWKEYSKTVVMESTIGDLIRPEGWMPWDGNFALNTLYYAEYGNRGPGAATNRRVNWKGFHVIGRDEALQYTVGNWDQFQGDKWLKYTGAPYLAGLKY